MKILSPRTRLEGAGESSPMGFEPMTARRDAACSASCRLVGDVDAEAAAGTQADGRTFLSGGMMMRNIADDRPAGHCQRMVDHRFISVYRQRPVCIPDVSSVQARALTGSRMIPFHWLFHSIYGL